MCHYVFQCLFDDPSSWLPFLIGCLPTCAWIYLLLSCIDLKQIGLVGPEDDIASIATLKISPMFTLLNMHVHLYTPMNQPWWRNLLFSLQHLHLDHCEGPQKSRSNCNSVWVGIVTVHGWSMTPVSQQPKVHQGFEDANSKIILMHWSYGCYFQHKHISGSPFWWKCASINQPVGRTVRTEASIATERRPMWVHGLAVWFVFTIGHRSNPWKNEGFYLNPQHMKDGCGFPR